MSISRLIRRTLTQIDAVTAHRPGLKGQRKVDATHLYSPLPRLKQGGFEFKAVQRLS